MGLLNRAIRKSVLLAKSTLGLPTEQPLSVQFERQAPGWLADNLMAGVSQAQQGNPRVEQQVMQAQALGERPLWEGYRDIPDYPRSKTKGRTVGEVRSTPVTGSFFSWLAEARRPDYIVEFGTAFGVSGMYWLSGLEAAGTGHLMTYEPNTDWADIAEANLASISGRFTLTRGIFEEEAERTLTPGSVDIAFIDAIHTEAFVMRQWEVLKPFMRPGAIVLFDDISFSEDMAGCWRKVAHMPEAKASAALGNRVGIVELH